MDGNFMWVLYGLLHFPTAESLRRHAEMYGQYPAYPRIFFNHIEITVTIPFNYNLCVTVANNS